MKNDNLPASLKQLFYKGHLASGQTVDVDADTAHRLSRVLRLRSGDRVALFNGRDGLFEVTITHDKAKHMTIGACLRPQPVAPAVWLLLALPKRDALDRALRQATELGVTHIVPVLSDHAVPDRLNTDRAQALLVEAAEQCERLSLPQLHSPTRLQDALALLPGQLFWCDERAARQGQGQWQGGKSHSGDGLLIGPEGGFSTAERTLLDATKNVTPVGLGQHVLRVDTAVCAGLARFFDHLQPSATPA